MSQLPRSTPARSMPRKVRRRDFVTGSARWGAALGAAPFVPLLSELRSSAQAADGFPLRLILLFNPNGTLQEHFWPTSAAGATTASLKDYTFNTITKPLEPFRERLLFLHGLGIEVAKTGPGGPHQKGVGGLFTNSELQTGTFVDGDGAKSGWANGISIDQELANRVGKNNFLTSLELGVRATQAEVRSRISYAGPANPLPPINSPRGAFDRLFSGLGEVSEEVRATRRSVIDLIQAQYADVIPRLGEVDARKLEQHSELVRGIERRLDLAVNTRVCAAPTRPVEMAEDDEAQMVEISRLQIELMSLAVACDLTRVGSIQYSSAINDIRYPWLDSPGSGHALSHSGPTNLAATAEMLRRYDWHSAQMAYLMAQLDAIPEGEGSALDNTIIIWGNELGMGNAHSHTDIPFVVGGGAGGKWEMGRYLRFNNEAHAGLWISLLHAFGFDD
ncbi:MAG: hypothetical protein RJA70_3330, partial [Pseudomonadota bacterium]